MSIMNLPSTPLEQASAVRKKAKGIKNKTNNSFFIVQMSTFYEY